MYDIYQFQDRSSKTAISIGSNGGLVGAESSGNLRFSSSKTNTDSNVLDKRAHYLVEGIKSGNRGCLAEGITLVETEHRGKKLVAKRLLETILNLNKVDGAKNSFRIGECN